MEYNSSNTEITDGVSSEGEFYKVSLKNMNIYGQIFNDFGVVEVKDSMEEDVVGRVNNMQNHLCVYSSSEEVSESEQDRFLRFVETQ